MLQYGKQKPLQLIADFIVLPRLSDLQFQQGLHWRHLLSAPQEVCAVSADRKM